MHLSIVTYTLSWGTDMYACMCIHRITACIEPQGMHIYAYVNSRYTYVFVYV